MRPFYCRGELLHRLDGCEIEDSVRRNDLSRAATLTDIQLAEAGADCTLAKIFQIECERNLDGVDPFRLQQLDDWRNAVRRGDKELPTRPQIFPRGTLFLPEPLFPILMKPNDTEEAVPLPPGRSPPQPWYHGPQTKGGNTASNQK
jgi:hypothetical protein